MLFHLLTFFRFANAFGKDERRTFLVPSNVELKHRLDHGSRLFPKVMGGKFSQKVDVEIFARERRRKA